MCTHFKKFRTILFTYLLISFNLIAFGQSVIINTTLTPPYTVPFDNLKEQASVTVTNTSRNNINSGSLQLYIEGDNGIIIQSKSTFFDPVLDVAPGTSVTFNGMSGDLDNLFNANNLTFTGVTSTTVYSSGLPAGNYSLCFRALDSDGGPISADPPSGCSMFSIQGISHVNVVTQVTPPYSTDLTNYSNNTLVMLQSTDSGDVSLFLDISGDNGVHLQTKESYLPYNIVLVGTPLNVNAFDLAPYFDFQNLVSLGAPITEIQQNGLPPGQYQICIRVRADNGEFVSDEEPAGCSNMLSINAVEPPQLINPICGDEINSGSNNMVFSWTAPPGASPATTEYTLKIIELFPNQDPNQAFLSATTPPFYEKSVFSQTSILYGPTDPLLEDGKSYAWQVIAKDDELKTPFQNDGRSEVCWFTWKSQEQPGIPVLVTDVKENKPTATFTIVPGFMPQSTVKGKLLYKFKGDNNPIRKAKSGVENSNVKVYNPNVKPNAPPGASVSVEGAKPLPGVSVSLVVTYLFNGTYEGNKQNFSPANHYQIGALISENAKASDQVLATTITQADGSFVFDHFINPYEDYGKFLQSVSPNGDVLKFNGDMYRVLRLKVNNQYYLSPDINIIANPWEEKDLGDIVSYVKSYNLEVTTQWIKGAMDVKEGYQGKLNNVKVQLYRNTAPNHVPADEGNRNANVRPGSNIVIASGATAGEGTILFKNLVQHNPNDKADRYRLKAEEPEIGENTYKTKNKIYTDHKGTTSFPYNSEQTAIPSDAIISGNFINTVILGSDIVWNHELIVKTYREPIELIPRLPSISGQVQTQDAGVKLPKGIGVVLMNFKQKNESDIPLFLKTKTTDVFGSYQFKDLSMEYGDYAKDKNGETMLTVIGPKRILYTKPSGFKLDSIKVLILKWGMKITSPQGDFKLIPDGYLSGTVEDESGNPVKAIVNVDDLSVYETKTSFTPVPQNNNGKTNQDNTFKVINYTSKEVFDFKAPSGNARKLQIKAVNAELYGILDTIITIPKASSANNKSLTIVLNKKRKRIRFRVIEYKKGLKQNLKSLQTPIAAAKVTLQDVPGFDKPHTTDPDGYVSFVFDSNVDDFSFKIEPPAGKEVEYNSEIFEVKNLVSSVKMVDAVNFAYLKKAAKISGTVKVEGKTLKGAEVYFEKGDGIQIKASTDDAGHYTLTGIAQDFGTIILWAGKTNSTPNIISQKKEIELKDNNTVDFDLKYDKEVSITDIFGFKVSIKEKQKQSDGSYTIDGNLITIPSNQNFALKEAEKVLAFSNLIIKNSGKTDSYGTPVFEPAKSTVSLNDKQLEIKVNNTFFAILGTGSKQLSLAEIDNKGFIKDVVGIENTSFSFDKAYLNLQNDKDIYLTSQQGGSDMNIKAVSVENNKVEKFGIVNAENKEVSYKLGKFNAKALQSKSYLEGDAIVLYTQLSTNKIEGMVPEKLEIEAGDLVIKTGGLIPIKNDNPIKFKLEKWGFESEKWTLNTENARIEMVNGKIQTSLFDVPAKNITITPDAFDIGSFELGQLKLGDMVNLNVIGNYTSFGLNQSVGSDKGTHWELRVTGENSTPAATVILPGFETGKTINFKKISLLSNGEQQTGLDNNEPLKFYNIIDVTPVSIFSGPGYIDLTTTTDLGIPKVLENTGFIRFLKEGSNIKVKVAPIPFKIDIPGKVSFSVGNKLEDTSVKENFFSATGFLEDKEGIQLTATIKKTPAKTEIEIDKGQKLQLGDSQTSFADIEGTIGIDKNTKDWEKLSFSGEMKGFKGIKKGKRQTFTVHGNITANDESVGVDNINTPFGNMALTYDIKNSRFLGNLNINQNLGPVKFIGSANMLVGSHGWYLSAGGQATPPGIGEISMGLIIGNSDYLPAEVTTTLMQYAYDKNVPPTIKNGVSGMFITGRKDVPIINIPDWKIDLGVVSAAMGAKAGLDARIWMNFDSNANEYGIGAMAFAHVYFSASSITCTNFGAEARAELGAKGSYNTANGNFNLDGCGSITVGGHFEQCVPTVFAGCKWCVGTSISKSVKLDLHFDSGGNTDLSFGFGNCSKQPLSGGW